MKFTFKGIIIILILAVVLLKLTIVHNATYYLKQVLFFFILLTELKSGHFIREHFSAYEMQLNSKHTFSSWMISRQPTNIIESGLTRAQVAY